MSDKQLLFDLIVLLLGLGFGVLIGYVIGMRDNIEETLRIDKEFVRDYMRLFKKYYELKNKE